MLTAVVLILLDGVNVVNGTKVLNTKELFQMPLCSDVQRNQSCELGSSPYYSSRIFLCEEAGYDVNLKQGRGSGTPWKMTGRPPSCGFQAAGAAME